MMETDQADVSKEISEKDTKPSIPKKAKKKNKKSTSSKSVETMFRNAYRAQLDLIALAATKANIMISLNGVIVSIMMVTGGFIYDHSPSFLLPAILFLITSAISIYFALSAASPTPDPAHTRVFCCIRDVITGKATLRDFKNYVILPDQRFDIKTSNILIFDDFANLPKETYLQYMSDLIKDPDEIYKKMSDQLYRLGSVANKKFSMLRYSYSVFRWGLIFSSLLFLFLKTSQVYFPEDTIDIKPGQNSEIKIFKFNNVYEPSGVQQLPDGRLILVEDEPEWPIHIMNLLPNGKISENKTFNRLLRLAFKTRLNDLEAITIGPDGFIYATTSHKHNKKGNRKADREQLIRFNIKGNLISDISIVTDLHDAIDASAVLGKVNKQGKGGLYNLNIEALGFDKQKRLMLGLRNPKINGKSVILVLQNPFAVFDKKEAPKIAKTPILLNLNGGGIRSISYDPALHGYLISHEVYSGETKHSQLVFWDGKPPHKPQPINIPELDHINSIEGIAPVTIDHQTRILLVSDNGDRRHNQPANYLLLDHKQLIIE